MGDDLPDKVASVLQMRRNITSMLRQLKIETLKACPICGGHDSDVLLSSPEGYMPEGILHIYQCRTCSQAYLNPRLTLDSVVEVENESTVYEYSSDKARESILLLMEMITWLESMGARRNRLLDLGSNHGLLLEAARRLGWQAVGV